MLNNAYLKIILTLIAVELLVLIFKTNTTEKLLADYATAQQAKQEIVPARYTIPNAFNGAEQKVTNVNIVAIGGEQVPISQVGAGLPVYPFNFINKSTNKAVPLVVQPGTP